jgi:hypothetical protein
MNFSLKSRVVALVAVLAAALAIYQITPGVRLQAKQEALLEWAQSGAPGDFPEEFAAPDFHTPWGYTAAEVPGGILNLRLAFPAMNISGGKPEFSRDGSTASVKQTIKVSGTDEYRSVPVTFRWQRQSWLPWSWRLVTVEADGLDWEEGPP